MPPGKRRNLSDVIAETVPEEKGFTTPEPPAPMGRKPAPVRSTMDLPPDEHAAFLTWAVEASHTVGRSVRGQNVLRAMVRRLLVDEAFARQVLQDLADGKGGI